VEIDHGNDYKSTFIFECKNRKKSVSKNDIIVFSEKIKIIGAQKGLFVAKSYSPDSKAQAEKDNRIKLLLATEHPIEKFLIPIKIEFSQKSKVRGTIRLLSPFPHSFPPGPLKGITHKLCTLNSKPLDFDKYLKDWINSTADERLAMASTPRRNSGKFTLQKDVVREFLEKELIIDGKIVTKIFLNVDFTLDVYHPGLISHYEVESRGRVISYEPITLADGGNIQMSLLSITAD